MMFRAEERDPEGTRHQPLSRHRREPGENAHPARPCTPGLPSALTCIEALAFLPVVTRDAVRFPRRAEGRAQDRLVACWRVVGAESGLGRLPPGLGGGDAARRNERPEPWRGGPAPGRA